MVDFVRAASAWAAPLRAVPAKAEFVRAAPPMVDFVRAASAWAAPLSNACNGRFCEGSICQGSTC
jgi:hypothetical protein